MKGTEPPAEFGTVMRMGEEGDAEIISLDAFRGGAEPQLQVLRGPTCWCSLVFSERERTVTCKKCGKVYDHFDALVYVVRNWSRYAANRDAMKHECERLTALRDELRTEVKNLKAQRQRWRGESK